MKKVLVKGATGFIGNYIIAQFLARKVNVIATSSDINKATAAAWYPFVKYFELDFKNICNSVNNYTYFENPDAMIHVAWEGLPNYKENQCAFGAM